MVRSEEDKYCSRLIVSIFYVELKHDVWLDCGLLVLKMERLFAAKCLSSTYWLYAVSCFCTILKGEEGEKLYREFLKWQQSSGSGSCFRSGIREQSTGGSSTCGKEMKAHLFVRPGLRMLFASVGKKYCSFALYFKNDSLPLVGTFNSELVMLLSLLLLLLHPSPHSPHRIHLTSRDICSLCCRAALWFLW